MGFLRRLFGVISGKEPIVGGIYVSKYSEGAYPYRVHKVLDSSESFVAIRKYRNAFKEIPKNLDLKSLCLTMPRKEDIEADPTLMTPDSPIQIAVGCVAIDKIGYMSGLPVFIDYQDVTDEERRNVDSMVKDMTARNQ